MKYIKICLIGCLMFITGWTNVTIVPSESKMYIDGICRDIPEAVFSNTSKEIRVITANKEDGIIAYKYNGDSFKLKPVDISSYVMAWNQADFVAKNVPPSMYKPDDDSTTIVQIIINTKITIRELESELSSEPDNPLYNKELNRLRDIHESYKIKLQKLIADQNHKPINQ